MPSPSPSIDLAQFAASHPREYEYMQDLIQARKTEVDSQLYDDYASKESELSEAEETLRKDQAYVRQQKEWIEEQKKYLEEWEKDLRDHEEERRRACERLAQEPREKSWHERAVRWNDTVPASPTSVSQQVRRLEENMSPYTASLSATPTPTSSSAFPSPRYASIFSNSSAGTRLGSRMQSWASSSSGMTYTDMAKEDRRLASEREILEKWRQSLIFWHNRIVHILAENGFVVELDGGGDGVHEPPVRRKTL